MNNSTSTIHIPDRKGKCQPPVQKLRVTGLAAESDVRLFEGRTWSVEHKVAWCCLETDRGISCPIWMKQQLGPPGKMAELPELMPASDAWTRLEPSCLEKT